MRFGKIHYLTIIILIHYNLLMGYKIIIKIKMKKILYANMFSNIHKIKTILII